MSKLNQSQIVNQTVVLAQLLLERIDLLTDASDVGGAHRLIEHLEEYLIRTENEVGSDD